MGYGDDYGREEAREVLEWCVCRACGAVYYGDFRADCPDCESCDTISEPEAIDLLAEIEAAKKEV